MQDSRLQTGPKVSEATNDSAPFATPFDTALPAFHPFRSNRIIVMAARDALFENEKRPQLTISARLMDKGVLVTAAGLPLFSLALDEYSQSTNSRVELHRLSSPGEAELLLKPRVLSFEQLNLVDDCRAGWRKLSSGGKPFLTGFVCKTGHDTEC